MRAFSPNLAAIAVTTCLKDNGHSATYLDLAFEFGVPFTEESRRARDRALAAHFEANPVDNLFISCVSAAEHLTLAAVARVAREALPGAIIGVGSYHANTLRENLLRQIPEIDFVFLGDIEPAVAALMERLRLRDRRALASMANVLVRTDEDVSARLARPAGYGAASRFDFGVSRKYMKYYDCLATVAGKGCPFPCTFCQEKHVRHGHSLRPPAEVVDEAHRNLAVYAEETGRRSIPYGFMDPLFGLNRSWTAEFCREILKRPLGVPWGFQTRVGQFDSTELARLAEAGCAVIYVGLETFSPEMLRRMRKTPDPVHYLARFRQDIDNFGKLGIQLEANILFGFPGESRRTLQETRNGIAEMKAVLSHPSLNLNLYRPFIDTQDLVGNADAPESRLLIRDWWDKGVAPGVTILVEPGPDLPASELVHFFEEMYADDACYQRRGVTADMDSLFREGNVGVDSLELISGRSRARQGTPIECYSNCGDGI